MGIRLGFSLVMGIPDLKVEDYEITDERWNAPQDWLDTPIVLPEEPSAENMTIDEEYLKSSSLYFTLKTMQADRAKDRELQAWNIIEHRIEYGNPSVIGMKIDSLYADELLYAFAAIHPEYNQENSPGFHIFKSQTPEETREDHQWCFWYKLWLKNKISDKHPGYSMAMMFKDLLDTNQNHGINSFAAPDWARTAHYVLKETLKMDIALSDMTLMLVWQWS